MRNLSDQWVMYMLRTQWRQYMYEINESSVWDQRVIWFPHGIFDLHTYIVVVEFVTCTWLIDLDLHMTRCMSREMSHVTHMNESCHTYKWVTSHTWMSHVTHINESRHTHEWVMSHICCMSSQESQRRQYMYEINESCVSQEGTMRSMSHVHVTNSIGM